MLSPRQPTGPHTDGRCQVLSHSKLMGEQRQNGVQPNLQPKRGTSKEHLGPVHWKKKRSAQSYPFGVSIARRRYTFFCSIHHVSTFPFLALSEYLFLAARRGSRVTPPLGDTSPPYKGFHPALTCLPCLQQTH